MNKADLAKILHENILPFWCNRMVDEDQGGFYGRIDGHSVLHPEADKAIILNTRILWGFASAFQFTKDVKHKQLADRAYAYLMSHFIDPEYGGVYWLLDYRGSAVNEKKQIYAQAFAIYALVAYYKITRDRKVLEQAINLYEKIEQHSFDTAQNGYFEALDRSWGSLSDVRLSEKDMNASKTMNTHLHVLEAYTSLLTVWPDSKLKKQLINLIELMSTTFLYDNGHFKLFFDDNWQLLSDEISFGHDIEGAWLLCEAAEVLNDEPFINSVNKLALKMTDAALEGMDDDGGLMNEANATGLTDTDKHWWPQAEALVGLVNAWQISGDQKYLKQADKTWGFINSYLINAAGEWHWKVTQDHRQTQVEDLAGPWKSFYHNSRALLELHSRL